MWNGATAAYLQRGLVLVAGMFLLHSSSFSSVGMRPFTSNEENRRPRQQSGQGGLCPFFFFLLAVIPLPPLFFFREIETPGFVSE